MTGIIALTFFSAGIGLLLFSGDMLTRTSLRFATLLNINPLVAGLTITAFATSSPEAAVAIDAAFLGTTDIALGNVIGSNIANILLVLGLPAMFVAISTDVKQIRRHFLMMAGASFLLFAFALKGSIGFLGGLGFLFLVVAWVIYSFKKNIGSVPDIAADENAAAAATHPAQKPQLTSLTIVLFLASAIGLWLGAHLTLEGSKQLAELFGLSDAVIALTLIAIGTSLPELAISVSALWQKQGGIALGNILGSNLLNILFVLGIAAVITPITIDKAFLQLDMLVMLGAVFLLAPFVWWHKSLTRITGGVMVLIYVFYIVSLVGFRPSLVG